MLERFRQWLYMRRRMRDRKYLWPEYQFHMQDRDHAIAAMSMHMLLNDHWLPDDFEELPSPFYLVLEQCLEETADWGPAGRHLYNIPVEADAIPDKEGYLVDG